ncbi:MAG: DUF1553 domain-containing protein, partial [Saprospiraceae bacterium]|nr:DUF1553 domain-containing protein [Saprospiraceae bacterium]
AFSPSEKPGLPQGSSQENPIDLFIRDRLQQEGLKPAAVASREKIIRRLSFDLRGLPPSLEEIDAFLADDREEAYELLVDRFLAEKTYGERMAMEWMDLARYADSHGYQDDIERSMWPWRDWVIEAFNQNMPYDQFVSWQLAGDLLPDATYEQKLATGFNRNHKITQEVGVIDEEYRVTYVLDRVNTFSTAFLGLTVECAQCHDHKYDPITQKDYYSLFGFFNNVPEKGRVDYGVEVAQPALPLPEEKVAALRAYVQGMLEEQTQKVKNYQDNQWAKGFTHQGQETESTSAMGHIPSGLVAYYPLDYIDNNRINDVRNQRTEPVINQLIPVTGKHSGALEFMGTNYANLKNIKSLNFNRPFSLSFWIKSLDGGIRGTVLAALADEENSTFLVNITNDKTINVQWHNFRNETSFQILSKETLPADQWAHISLTYDGLNKKTGVKLYLDGKLLNPYLRKSDLRGGIPETSILLLGKGTGEKGLMAGQLDEVMLFNRVLRPTEISQLINYDPVLALESKKIKTQSDLKRLFFEQLTHEDGYYQALTERLREYKIREGRTEDIVLKPTMIMHDRDTARATFVLDRGQYDAPREQVEPGTPSAVMPFDPTSDKNRLGLARWLFDPENPLTARVAVNRYWQMIFGRGLVATPGDFGSQGSLPSHPALLDWLAVTFTESGWDVKQLIKTMVTSVTYQQDVQMSDRLKRVDPQNILLARGPQVRLPAEMVRDHALNASGLLSKKIGGPSVKPYQPQGLWLEVASGNQSLRKYIQDHGADLYRRSLYTFWKRTIPPPSMTIFDAPTREQCIVKRGATSTPMQALVLLNDPQFVEAARLVATRVLSMEAATSEDRITSAFRLATSRYPNAEELKILLNLLEEEIREFETNPTGAEQLLNIGEQSKDEKQDAIQLAAYTIVANAIFNLTESIMKG